MAYNHRTPPTILLNDIMERVNALGHEPRVLIELDKMIYVPGLKSKFEVVDYVVSNSIVQYQVTGGSSKGGEPDPPATGGGTAGESGDRFEAIKCALVDACNQWGLITSGFNGINMDAYYFLLAVAKHETGFGTLGQGRKEKGSFILGYGCPGSCNFAYSGIKTQAYYGAKRFKEAMKSRGYKVSSFNDVDYFHEGGDKGYGTWVWSADGANWKNRVWSYYQQIKNEAGSVTTIGGSGKWQCPTPNVVLLNKSPNTAYVLDYGNESDCGCDDEDYYEVQSTTKSEIELVEKSDVSKSATLAGMGVPPVFPIAGATYGSGSVKTSSYGMRGGSMHHGIDLQAPGGSAGSYGKDIVAAYDGVVHRSAVIGGYGECVQIRHSNGYHTVYAHLVKGSRTVSAGQQVKAGQKVGEMGNTGNVLPKPTSSKPLQGTHLHFEIWKGVPYRSSSINPEPYLKGAELIPASVTNSDGSPAGAPFTVTENVKFKKCFNNDGNLSKDFYNKEDLSWYTDVKTAKKAVGYKKGQIPKDGFGSFGYTHNFSADGFFSYECVMELVVGDSVTVAVDGVPIAKYTSADNGKTIVSAPYYLQFVGGENNAGVNTHVIDFFLDSPSGKSSFGITCFTVTEIEVTSGGIGASQYTPRKTEKWYEVGGYVYDTTFYLEDDIMEWEVNTHFDMKSATATFTLSNQDGLYSPYYEKVNNFPENLKDSPLSYYDQGILCHVLSEATPVRIYAGYGDQLVRVFTGKIKGEIEENSEERTVTVHCVDMYDMLEEHVFHVQVSYPDTNDVTHGDTSDRAPWVKSAIIHNIVKRAGLTEWRFHEDDLKYPDVIIEDTYYIDIDRGGTKATVIENGQYVVKDLNTVKDVGGYRNPYVQSISFPQGTRASDAITEIIGDIHYRAYCDRYGTFRLESTLDLKNNDLWEFKDDDNLYVLDSSIDYSRARNHLMIVGSQGKTEHFFDKQLIMATKGNIRTAQVELGWLDESYGGTARGAKEQVAQKLFFDMKRQARTFNVVVKGNPLMDILDGVYVYDRNTSTSGYYLIKGNRLVGNKEGMLNFVELTWEDISGRY